MQGEIVRQCVDDVVDAVHAVDGAERRVARGNLVGLRECEYMDSKFGGLLADGVARRPGERTGTERAIVTTQADKTNTPSDALEVAGHGG